MIHASTVAAAGGGPVGPGPAPTPADDLPDDYPGFHIHDKIPTDLPEDERFQMLIEEICEMQCKEEKARLIAEHGAELGTKIAKQLEGALSEFQLKVEEMVVRGDIKFGPGGDGDGDGDGDGIGDALLDVRDAKEEAMTAVMTQLENELEQWNEIEKQVAEEGSGPSEAEEALAKVDAEEAMNAVKVLMEAEAAATAAGTAGEGEAVVIPGHLREAVEEAKRKLGMQAEGLTALCDGVEALCVRAERACEVFSGALAENDFKGLPHVNSPHNLIKSLVASKKAEKDEGK